MPLSKARQAEYMREHRKRQKLAAILREPLIRYNKEVLEPAVIPKLDADGGAIPDYW